MRYHCAACGEVVEKKCGLPPYQQEFCGLAEFTRPWPWTPENMITSQAAEYADVRDGFEKGWEIGPMLVHHIGPDDLENLLQQFAYLTDSGWIAPKWIENLFAASPHFKEL